LYRATRFLRTIADEDAVGGLGRGVSPTKSARSSRWAGCVASCRRKWYWNSDSLPANPLSCRQPFAENDISLEATSKFLKTPVGEFALKGIRRPLAAYNVLVANRET
jgi:hypothetical protein